MLEGLSTSGKCLIIYIRGCFLASPAQVKTCIGDSEKILERKAYLLCLYREKQKRKAKVMYDQLEFCSWSQSPLLKLSHEKNRSSLLLVKGNENISMCAYLCVFVCVCAWWEIYITHVHSKRWEGLCFPKQVQWPGSIPEDIDRMVFVPVWYSDSCQK